MRDQIKRLAMLSGERAPAFASFDITSLLPSWTEQIDSRVLAYFATAIPAESFSPGHFELLSPQDITSESTRFVPGVDLYRGGFVPIATTGSGDAVTIDITSGAVLVFCHESRYPGHLSHDAVTKLAEEVFHSIEEFFAEWEQRLRSPE